ncbi:type III secretion protein [Pseudomonas sp. JUb42]|uniref:type III secretion protein n=1 Tax=Pseudomonas sp. JUb42 TaxID=2940611 RepID=UPI002168E811|nr:type III secretion protein [Pseudomonas sp. JUb42]
MNSLPQEGLLSRLSMWCLRKVRLVLCLLLLAPLPAFAESTDDPTWFSQPYAYVLVEQDVRAALTEFGHNLGLIVVLSDKVRGKSRSVVRGATAGDFLTQLCDTNGLGWYFDGNVLYLNADDEIATRLFKGQGHLNLDQLRGYLAGLDVYGKQLSMRPSPDGDELFVSGPPPYLNMIQQHIDQQPRPVVAPVARERGMRVFRGSVVSDN